MHNINTKNNVLKVFILFFILGCNNIYSRNKEELLFLAHEFDMRDYLGICYDISENGKLILYYPNKKTACNNGQFIKYKEFNLDTIFISIERLNSAWVENLILHDFFTAKVFYIVSNRDPGIVVMFNKNKNTLKLFAIDGQFPPCVCASCTEFENGYRCSTSFSAIDTFKYNNLQAALEFIVIFGAYDKCDNIPKKYRIPE